MSEHLSNCGFHVEQYPWECTCGLSYIELRDECTRLRGRIAELERERDAERQEMNRLEERLWSIIDRYGLADCGSDVVEAVSYMQRRIAELERKIIHPDPALWDRLTPPARQP